MKLPPIRFDLTVDEVETAVRPILDQAKAAIDASLKGEGYFKSKEWAEIQDWGRPDFVPPTHLSSRERFRLQRLLDQAKRELDKKERLTKQLGEAIAWLSSAKTLIAVSETESIRDGQHRCEQLIQEALDAMGPREEGDEWRRLTDT